MPSCEGSNPKCPDNMPVDRILVESKQIAASAMSRLWDLTEPGCRTGMREVKEPGCRTSRWGFTEPGCRTGMGDVKEPGCRTSMWERNKPGCRTSTWEVTEPGCRTSLSRTHAMPKEPQALSPQVGESRAPITSQSQRRLYGIRQATQDVTAVDSPGPRGGRT